MSKLVSIYALVDPENFEIRYVGASKAPRKRLSHHLMTARKHRGDNPAKEEWIRTLLAQGLKPLLEILECTTVDKWQAAERYWIGCCRVFGFDLTNIDRGGRGLPSLTHSDETRQKHSVRQLGKKHNDEWITNIRTSLQSEEYRERQSSLKQGEQRNIPTKTSKYVGVCYDKRRAHHKKSWRSNIKVNNKQKYLGVFATEIEAAARYNEAALEYFGDDATLNILG